MCRDLLAAGVQRRRQGTQLGVARQLGLEAERAVSRRRGGHELHERVVERERAPLQHRPAGRPAACVPSDVSVPLTSWLSPKCTPRSPSSTSIVQLGRAARPARGEQDEERDEQIAATGHIEGTRSRFLVRRADADGEPREAMTAHAMGSAPTRSRRSASGSGGSGERTCVVNVGTDLRRSEAPARQRGRRAGGRRRLSRLRLRPHVRAPLRARRARLDGRPVGRGWATPAARSSWPPASRASCATSASCRPTTAGRCCRRPPRRCARC